MSEDPPAQKRAHYRLRYPAAERPTVRAGDREYQVAELSEAGARLVLGPGDPKVGPRAPFAGFLAFRDGEVVVVRGEWLRVGGEEGVVRLSAGVSLRRMLDEQRRLRRLYPGLFADDAGDDETGPG